jgi:hypothetical protein
MQEYKAEDDMNLTFDQRKSLDRGDPVPIEENGLQCVLVRADVFERISSLASGEWTPEEMRRLALRTWEDADSAGPIS